MYSRLPYVALVLVLVAGLARGQCPCPGATYCVSDFAQLTSVLTTQPLQPGDIICVQPGTPGSVYSVTQAIPITSQGAPGNPITIRGVRSPSGARPVLEAGPQVLRTGILEFTAAARHWVVEGLELRGATHSGVNSWEGPAGIHIAGRDVAVRDCDTHSNGIGFYSLRTAGELLFERCAIHGNGRHNFSALAESVTLRGCHLYDLAQGSVNYKGRCRVAVLEGNLIEGVSSGSYDVDFAGSWAPSATAAPVPSYALMLGNVVLHDDPGATPTIINLGDGSPSAGSHPRLGFVDLVHNTIVAANSNPAVFRRFWEQSGAGNSATAILRLHNNIVHNLNAGNEGNKLFRAGGGTFAENLAAWSAFPTEGGGNWYALLGDFDVQNYAPALFASATFGLDPGFESASAPYDFSLRTGAPARDLGDPAPRTNVPQAPGPLQLQRVARPLLHFDPARTVPALALRRDEGPLDHGAFEGSANQPAIELALGGSFSLGAGVELLPGPLRLGLALPEGALYLLLGASGLSAAPISIPPIQGQLLLDPAGAFLAVLAQGSRGPSGIEEFAIPIPGEPRLAGAQLAFQSLTCDLLGTGQCTWSAQAPLLTLTP